MSLAQTKIRLASRGSLNAADVETVYGELVRVVGGTRYVGGVSTTAPGVLDYRNFSPSAGIPNAAKANPASLWPLQMVIENVNLGSVDVYAPFVWENTGIISATIVGWSAMYSNSSAAGTNITWTLNRRRQGVDTAVGTVATTSAGGETLVTNQTGLSVDLLPRDIVKVTIATAGTTVLTHAAVHAWVRTVHVK